MAFFRYRLKTFQRSQNLEASGNTPWSLGAGRITNKPRFVR